jgi:hypothetical protein
MIRSAIVARRNGSGSPRRLRPAVLLEVGGDGAALLLVEGTIGHAISRIGCRCVEIAQLVLVGQCGMRYLIAT